MADSTVKVSFIGDSSSLKRASDDADGHLGKLGDGIGKVAKAAAVGFAAAGVAAGAFAVSAISAASDLAESQSKVNVVFNTAAKEITDWSAKSATAFGMSKQQALEAAGTFGNLFSAMKISQQESVKMSKGIVELAADLASFNNANPADVLIALKAGLVGETEPLRAFGVNLSAARIEAHALSTGLVKGTVDLVKLEAAQIKMNEAEKKYIEIQRKYGTESAEGTKANNERSKAMDALNKVMGGAKPVLDAATKATAAYALIMADTALAQGDFARTSDGLANQSRILKAQFSDLQAEIGAKLLPVAVALASALSEKVFPAIEAISKDPRFKQFLADVGAFIQEHVIPAFQALGGWIRDDLQPALGNMRDAFLKDIWPVLEEKVIPAMKTLGIWIKDNLLPMIGAIAIIILEQVLPAFFKLVKFIDEEIVPAIMAIVGPIAKLVEIVDKLTSALFGHGGSTFDPLGGWQPSGETFLGPDGKPVFGAVGESFVTPGGKRAGFAMGGMVGGALGAPQLAVVHGGERVLTPAQQRGGGQTFIFEMNGREFARAIVDESTRSGGLPIRIRAAS